LPSGVEAHFTWFQPLRFFAVFEDPTLQIAVVVEREAISMTALELLGIFDE
jgi:hypothetical protein